MSPKIQQKRLTGDIASLLWFTWKDIGVYGIWYMKLISPYKCNGCGLPFEADFMLIRIIVKFLQGDNGS